MNDLAILHTSPLGKHNDKELSLFTSLDDSNPVHKMALFGIMQAPTFDLRDMLGKVFQAENVAVWDTVNLDEETGEERVIRRAAFITRDGESIGTTSEPVIKNIARMIAFWGPPPWSPPLNMRGREKRSKEGRAYHLVDIVP